MWLGSPVWFLRKLGRRGIKLLWRKQGPTGGGVQQPPSAEHGRGWVQEPSSLASKILLATLLFTWTRPSSRRTVGVVSPWVDGMVRSIMCLPRREAGCDHGLCATVLSRLEPLRVVGRESGSARRVVYSQCFMRKGISRVGATRSVDEHRGARNGAERRVALRQQLRALAARHLDDHLAEALLVEEEEVLHGVRGWVEALRRDAVFGRAERTPVLVVRGEPPPQRAHCDEDTGNTRRTRDHEHKASGTASCCAPQPPRTLSAETKRLRVEKPKQNPHLCAEYTSSDTVRPLLTTVTAKRIRLSRTHAIVRHDRSRCHHAPVIYRPKLAKRINIRNNLPLIGIVHSGFLLLLIATAHQVGQQLRGDPCLLIAKGVAATHFCFQRVTAQVQRAYPL